MNKNLDNKKGVELTLSSIIQVIIVIIVIVVVILFFTGNFTDASTGIFDIGNGAVDAAKTGGE